MLPSGTKSDETEPTTSGHLARAKYAYCQHSVTEMSFDVGDVLALVGEPQDGWQYGQNRRTRGSVSIRRIYDIKVRTVERTGKNRMARISQRHDDWIIRPELEYLQVRTTGRACQYCTRATTRTVKTQVKQQNKKVRSIKEYDTCRSEMTLG